MSTIESLNVPPSFPSQASSVHTALTLSSEFPQNCPLSSQHSVAFPAQSSKALPQFHMLRSATAMPTVLVSVRVTTAVMKHHEPTRLEEARARFTYPESQSTEGRQGRNSERMETWRQELIDAEAMEGCCLQACSSWLPQPAFL